MTQYFIVTQADTDDRGRFSDNICTFNDKNGNVELYINAEEAREAIAKEVAQMCEDGTPFSVNGEEDVELSTWNEVYTYVMTQMKPKNQQYVLVFFPDGSQRNYTISQVNV